MTRDRIVVFGLYKTGTTAMFFNIKNSLSYTPRTLFEPTTFNCSKEDSVTGVLAKVIVCDSRVDYESFMPFERKVLIVRDPRDWVISGCLYLTQESDQIWRDPAVTESIIAVLRKKEAAPGNVHFCSILEKVLSNSTVGNMNNFVEYCATTLHEFIRFDEELGPHFRMFYEDFVDRDVGGLSDYLGIGINSEISVSTSFSHVERSKTYGNWRSWFTSQDREFFDPIFSPFLKHYGYDSSWELERNPVVDSSEGSEYVKRIIEKKRLNVR